MSGYMLLHTCMWCLDACPSCALSSAAWAAQVKALIAGDAPLLEKYERSLLESYVEVGLGP